MPTEKLCLASTNKLGRILASQPIVAHAMAAVTLTNYRTEQAQHMAILIVTMELIFHDAPKKNIKKKNDD